MQVFLVHVEDDIVLARLRTRQLARTVGLGVGDQARISLAASSIAHTLKMGGVHPGRIAIDGLQEDGRTGVRVVCTIADHDDSDGLLRSLASWPWNLMVDELMTRRLPSEEVEVTVVKWAA
jgi:hypothetical protein